MAETASALSTDDLLSAIDEAAEAEPAGPAAQTPAVVRVVVPTPQFKISPGPPATAAKSIASSWRSAPKRVVQEKPPTRMQRFAGAAYAFADRSLTVINGPFQRLSPKARSLIGWIAAATLVVSVSAAVFLPVLMPQRTALDFLRERVEHRVLQTAPKMTDLAQTP